MPVGAGLSSKADWSLPLAVLKEEDFLDSAVSVAHVDLSKKGKTAFSRPSYAMKVVCHVYDTDFWSLRNPMRRRGVIFCSET